MQSLFTLGYGLWFEPVLVLAVGTAVIVGLAALAGRWVGSAVWQRTLWQVAALGLVALVLFELTGIGPALVRIAGARIEAPVSQAPATPDAVAEPAPATVDLFAAGGRAPVEERVFRPGPSPRAEADLAASAAFDLDWPDEADWPPVASVAGVDDRYLAAADETAPANRVETAAEPAASPPAQEPSVGEPSEAAAVLPREPVHAWWPGVIWGLGAAAVVGWITWARSLLLVFRRRHPAVRDEALCRRVGRLARRLGIRRPVSLLRAAGLRTPVAFGTLRPTVVLPAAFADDFGSQEQEAMLAHELAHLAAWDPAWQLLADLLCAALWWHPLVWWLRRRLRAASEAAADEASLLVPDGPHLLAACLVALGRRISYPRRLGWLSVEGSGFRSSLGHRVERLLSLPLRSPRAPGRAASVVAKIALPIALIVVTVLSTAWVRPRAALREGGTTMNVLQTSWRGSLAAMALVAFLGPAPGDALADGPFGEEPVFAAASGDQLALLAEGEGEKREGEKREGEKREGEKREGERREGERREGEGERRERPDQPRERREGEGERREGEGERRERPDQPRERREGEGERREGEGERRERPDQPRERREGEGERREGERRDDVPREVRMQQLMQQRHALMERAGEIERKMAGLRDGQDAEARELRGAMEQVRQQMQRIEAMIRESQPGPEQPRQPGEEMERRLHHLRVAIENLRAAGLHEAAEHLQREAENLMRAFREGRPGEPDRPEHPEHREQPPHPEQLEGVIREMHGQMQQMRREMEEMRNQIRHLIERQGGEEK